MYDTLRFRFPVSDSERANIGSKLTGNITEKYSVNTGQYSVTGAIKRFRVSVYDTSVSVSGSLTALAYGTNGLNLTVEGARLCGGWLRELFGDACANGVVTRFDFGANLEMTRPTAAYTAVLADAPYFQRFPQPNGVLYRNTRNTRQIEFYDKTEQMLTTHNIELPENVLRYEVRLRQRPARAFDMRELRISDLCTPELFRAVVDKWQTQFSEIKTLPERPKPEVSIFKNPKTFNETMFRQGLQSAFGDAQTALTALRAAYKAGETSKFDYYRLRDKITNAFGSDLENGDLNAETPISELRRKVALTAFELKNDM